MTPNQTAMERTWYIPRSLQLGTKYRYSSLKRNDRNTLRDLENMEEQGLVVRVKVDIKTSRGRNTVGWSTTTSGELFRRVFERG